MAEVITFHSASACDSESATPAARLQAAGHEVATPDLHDGRAAASTANRQVRIAFRAALLLIQLAMR